MKICIDAGHNHSGWDTGAGGNRLREQDVTWKIADKLRRLLEGAGITVVMTRSSNEQNLGSDVDSSLRERTLICNKYKCDYFISIHCNAGGGTGTEVLVVRRGGMAETLAGYVLKHVVAVTGNSRGVKESPSYVLRKTDCPAILVETAFIDNVSDSAILRDRHDELAKAIFKGICECCGIAARNKYSYDDTVNQMILDGVTTVENMQFWERTLAEVPKEVRTIIERYQEQLKKK